MNIKRLILIFIAELVAVLLLHLLFYRYISYETVSNMMFTVGIIGFFTALTAVSRAYEMFYGFRYSMSSLFVRNFRQNFHSLSDYIESKKGTDEANKSTVFKEVLISSAIILLLAIVFGVMV